MRQSGGLCGRNHPPQTRRGSGDYRIIHHTGATFRAGTTPQPSISACFLPRRCRSPLSEPSGTVGCSAACLGRLPRHGWTPGGWSGGCGTSACALRSAPRPPRSRAARRSPPPRRPLPCPRVRRSSSRSIGRASVRSPAARRPIPEGSDPGRTDQGTAIRTSSQPCVVARARSPGRSSTVVVADSTIAGPAIACPGASPSKSSTTASVQPPR